MFIYKRFKSCFECTIAEKEETNIMLESQIDNDFLAGNLPTIFVMTIKVFEKVVRIEDDQSTSPSFVVV